MFLKLANFVPVLSPLAWAPRWMTSQIGRSAFSGACRNYNYRTGKVSNEKRKPVETEAQLLDALERFFANISEIEPIEVVDEELREYGYDLNALGGQIEVLAKRALANSQLNWRNQARQEIDATRTKLDSFELAVPDH
jgi:hypothetical protein